MLVKTAFKITPQRSTQYAHMVEELALPELLASPAGPQLSSITPITLAGQRYLLADGVQKQSETISLLSRLGAISEIYDYFEQLDDMTGPFLRPIEPQFTPFVPLEMAEARRYRGKTNEVFTQVLLNVAIFAGQYAGQALERLRILDPLAGGGTTLFLALAAGYDAFGIELERQDVETTTVFVRQYLENERIPFKEINEHRRAGRRVIFTIGPRSATRHFVLVQGDTSEAALHLREVPGGPRVHAIVGDLPYGIQHFGEIQTLLARALPAWEGLLLPGGTIALAWNATRIERAQMIELLEKSGGLRVLNDPPYTQFAHTVDRVIKRRDIVVAVKSV